MIITSDDFEEISRASQCCLCQKDFTPYEKVHSNIVRHHNHLTGDFIGMAHNQCNLKCKQAKHTCVIFHNLKKFDAHIICQSIGEFKGENLKCIAQSTENYVSFSLGNLRFIDSLQFLPSSLQSLVENLKCDGQDAFEHLIEEFPNSDDVKLLLRKGVYPYDYMDCESKFEEHCLPPAEAFYNALTKQHISEQDYKHACDVFDHFEMTSMGSYHDLYLKCDVILLCCVFERFRSMCMEQYGLDPCHFYTSPGLRWASCLKMTGVQLELMTDIDQVLFIEKGIRGGISQISNRYKQANNPLLSDYDSEKKLSHILYLDMCNLYGFAMQQPLPTSDFKFLKKREINQLDIRNIPADGEKGNIFEDNLRYPPELHDKHNDYPLAPERKAISDDMLSPYAQYLWKKLHHKTENEALPPRVKVEKLITSLEDKEKYVVHYRNLQLYLELGLEIMEIHRVLEFTQSAWMRPYIDFNTAQRKKAMSVFAKNFYKLMNNSCFGKT
ncbi:uncharacterized protein LOC128546441 [Mercenaria mercenaria]|uniref:uncharacterized protein LOC128546441 n=1 Tax=Mercenaria mercenaria TaxID=6596 RepID=UPI00234EDC43|nr:uncharacterized protein LOC128546441 [Mercenaria mercenaria]